MESCFLLRPGVPSKPDRFFAILRRAFAKLLGEAQNKMFEAIEAAIKADLRNREGGVREQERGVLQPDCAQEPIRTVCGELLEEPAEMKDADMAMARDFRQAQLALKV